MKFVDVDGGLMAFEIDSYESEVFPCFMVEHRFVPCEYSEEDTPVTWHSKYGMLVWWNATVGDCGFFHERVRELVPEGTMVFGSRENRGGGRFNYRVVIALPSVCYWERVEERFAMKRVIALEGGSDWEDPVEIFEVEGLSIVLPKIRQGVGKFLCCAQEYCRSYTQDYLEEEDRFFGRVIGVNERSLCSKEVSYCFICPFWSTGVCLTRKKYRNLRSV
jgi:hypothetical protein